MSERLSPSVKETFPELEKGSVHHGRLMKAYEVLEERRRQQKLTEVRAELRQIQGIAEPVQDEVQEQKPVERIPAETRPTEKEAFPRSGDIFVQGNLFGDLPTLVPERRRR